MACHSDHHLERFNMLWFVSEAGIREIWLLSTISGLVQLRSTLVDAMTIKNK